ncbi:GntR family transcriptional regulator [Bacillus sp. HMF5848]|uniref:GntR family transcriptional regulator n=1 Tax=Bacillus sp. HMF5848 TaxID=2495421 RepID=UPI000F790851|nr:GntR family transcriptional regulator [Bacillus sp. HMF5848]RSK27978.1 GntR family transcriptional regulator [Bacillus sp. HMF5848]
MEFTGDKPIYVQLADDVIRKIVRKEINPGDKLPSVREMALQSGVNPNTVQRTYSELERVEIVETKRGQGTFVTENVDILQRLKESLRRDSIQAFIQEMKLLGFTIDEMIDGLQEVKEDGRV